MCLLTDVALKATTSFVGSMTAIFVRHKKKVDHQET